MSIVELDNRWLIYLTDLALNTGEIINDAGQAVTHLILSVDDLVVELVDRLNEMSAQVVQLVLRLSLEISHLLVFTFA